MPGISWDSIPLEARERMALMNPDLAREMEAEAEADRLANMPPPTEEENKARLIAIQEELMAKLTIDPGVKRRVLQRLRATLESCEE